MGLKTKTIIGCVCLLGCLLGGCARPTALFNGKNLDGWKPFLADSGVSPSDVWSVEKGVLRCEGKPNGYIRTEKEYSNYKLHLEWRWTDKPTNSGVLLHLTGEDKIWPQCIEAQLMNQNAGDFYAIGGTGFQELKEGGRLPKKNPANEKEVGQWNTYDIVCRNDTITLTVNDLVQNEATGTSVSAGAIGLQSEGSPIEFRNIRLEPIR